MSNMNDDPEMQPKPDPEKYGQRLSWRISFESPFAPGPSNTLNRYKIVQPWRYRIDSDVDRNLQPYTRQIRGTPRKSIIHNRVNITQLREPSLRNRENASMFELSRLSHRGSKEYMKRLLEERSTRNKEYEAQMETLKSAEQRVYIYKCIIPEMTSNPWKELEEELLKTEETQESSYKNEV